MENVLTQSGLELVDFFATWCNPCKRMKPVIDELDSQNDNFVTHFVDIDENDNKKMAKAQGVKTIPTLILYKDGVKVACWEGGQDKSEVEAWLLSAIEDANE